MQLGCMSMYPLARREHKPTHLPMQIAVVNGALPYQNSAHLQDVDAQEFQ